MRSLILLSVFLFGMGLCGCGPSSPPASVPLVKPEKAGERSAIHGVIQNMQAKQEQKRAAWQQSLREGKTPSPTDFFFVEVSELQLTNLAGCPGDFRDAFQGLLQARQHQLRLAEMFQSQVPTWDGWQLIERKGIASNGPSHEREIAVAAQAYEVAWQKFGAVCARYP